MATEQSTYRATNDAYTGMLVISLIALIAGSSLLYVDWQQYPDAAPPKVPPKVLVREQPQAPQAQPKADEEPKKDEDKKGDVK